jgi:hypothetical protein
MGTTVDDFLNQNRKLRDAVNAIVEPGERIEVLIKGAWQEYVLGTDRRIIVFKKGFMTGSTFGSKVSSWEYRNVTAVDLRSNMMSGVLVIRAAGADDVDASYWAQGKNSASNAPNAITFSKKPSKEIEALVARLRQLVTEKQRAPLAQEAVAESPLEQLKKLGELRDAGVLTPQEFEEKKRQLLDLI